MFSVHDVCSSAVACGVMLRTPPSTTECHLLPVPGPVSFPRLKLLHCDTIKNNDDDDDDDDDDDESVGCSAASV